MKKVLLTGASGMVGSRFVELYSRKYDFIAPKYPNFDLTKKETIKKIIEEEKPDVVVNFAAYTDVSEAEKQRGDKNASCWKINVEGTKNLTSLIDSKKIHLIHISTDYVFPGSEEKPGPYSEEDIPETDPNNLTWYGFTKAEAERVVKSSFKDECTIFRIIYPVRATFEQKMDYLRKPLSLFDQGKLFPMFTDQQVTITFIDEACLALGKIIEGKIYGTFHACTPDTSTPFDLVNYLIEKARGVKNAVKSITLEEFIKKTGSSKTRYSKYGGLKVKSTEDKLGIKYSSWKEVIDKLVQQGIS